MLGSAVPAPALGDVVASGPHVRKFDASASNVRRGSRHQLQEEVGRVALQLLAEA